MILRGKKAALDAQFPHGNLQDLEVSYFIHRGRRFVLVVSAASSTVTICVVHWLFSFLV
jgi:hypothetical protein